MTTLKAKTSSSINRRQILAGGGAFASSAMLGIVSRPTSALASPTKGGVLRMAMAKGSTTDTLDPATFTYQSIATINYGLRNNLVEVGTDGLPQPELAESWESPDAKRWIFKIRKGVEFHDGKPLTADDVIASLQHHMGPNSTSAAKPLLKDVTNLKSDGSNTIVVDLSNPNAEFPVILTDYHLSVLPSKDGVADWQSGLGTGGYVLERYDAGVSTKMKRFANYWKENRAFADQAEILTINDVAARNNALVSGAVDIIDRCDLKTLPFLQRSPDIRVEEVAGSEHYTLPMNTTVSPFNDNNVRLALKLAIDREQLLRTILLGHGSVGNDHPISSILPYYAQDLEQRKYDPDKARFHLKQAGLSKLDVDLSCADVAFNGATDAMLLYSQSAKAANININVVREADDSYWNAVWMKKPFTASYWGGSPSENMMFTTAYSKGAEWNETFWDNPRFNELLVQARGELDESKRRQMYGEMQSLVRDDGGAIVLLFPNAIYAMNKKVAHHPEVTKIQPPDGARVVERWWIT